MSLLQSWKREFYYIDEPVQNASYIIQDIKASSYEYNYAIGVERRGLEYIFQYDVFGGRLVGGGFIIDFLVLSIPLPTPVWIHGEYWHSGKQKMIDDYQNELIRYTMAGKWALPIVHFGVEVATLELGLSAARKDFG